MFSQASPYITRKAFSHKSIVSHCIPMHPHINLLLCLFSLFPFSLCYLLMLLSCHGFDVEREGTWIASWLDVHTDLYTVE